MYQVILIYGNSQVHILTTQNDYFHKFMMAENTFFPQIQHSFTKTEAISKFKSYKP